MVLDIYERSVHLAPGLPRRIEHAQALTPDDIDRFKQLGVVASIQPIHATQDMAKVDRSWGERGRTAYAFASLLASGATLAFGSDTPVETMDPIAGLHAAVTRRRADGSPAEGWYGEERIALHDALHAYTSGAATATGETDRVGMLARGHHADFVVLSEDPFRLDDPMETLRVRADLTAVGGEIVFRREGAW
jgi:predicted amidohydrolase YtcJ